MRRTPRTIRKSMSARARRGTTQAEMIMATVLLAATLLSITTYRSQSIAGNLVAQRHSLAQSRTLNFRQELKTWPFEKVDRPSIEQAVVEESALLDRAKWTAVVTDIEEPIAGKQITLSLQWQVGDSEQQGPVLTFWIRRPEQ